jgi:hypothetical protein
MTAWVHWTAKTIMLTAGFAAAGGGLSTAAFAQTGPGGSAVTSGMGSVGGGNQVFAPITVPVNVCGNAVAVLGIAGAGCQGGASVHGHSGSPTMASDGMGSVLGGNQVVVPVTAPVDVCGNAVGNAHAGCRGGADVHGPSGGSSMVTSGMGSVLGGNQVKAPVTAPVDACGNSVAVLGIAGAGCKGGASVGSTGSCGCTGGSDAISSLLPFYRQGTSLASYDIPASAHSGAMPAAALSADENGGMSDATFFTLVGGVLLAGISALKISGRRGHQAGA